MAFVGSYLWQLRQVVGNDLILMPGAMVAVKHRDGRFLYTKRSDDESWCFPAGAAEPGGSFARTAIEELKEEAGITVAEEDLIPFGTLSEAGLHTITYPSGDITHCFALCFLAECWSGDPVADGEEAIGSKFAPIDHPPEPLHEPTAHAMGLLAAFTNTGRFQVR